MFLSASCLCAWATYAGRRPLRECSGTRLSRPACHTCILVDSAGTIDYHAGDAPDRRARAAAARRGYDLSALRARQVTPQDFETFHYLLAMDLDNLAYLHRVSPEEHRPKARLFLEFSTNASVREVPDPYYGPAGGFEHVLDLAEDACRGLLAHIKEQLKTASSR